MQKSILATIVSTVIPGLAKAQDLVEPISAMIDSLFL
jgi:hypothetical protein